MNYEHRERFFKQVKGKRLVRFEQGCVWKKGDYFVPTVLSGLHMTGRLFRENGSSRSDSWYIDSGFEKDWEFYKDEYENDRYLI